MFVDDGGRRKRLMRLAGMLIALLSIGLLSDRLIDAVAGFASVIGPAISARPHLDRFVFLISEE